ncbi:MAG: zinc-binding alcohol dehydrogenase, partial [Dehalococcoidia bacterium]|nr:zinc-binding alcohol dehydrogenase [Dehalococcoidia bacterium]
MKQLVQRGRDGELRVIDVPVPQIGPRELLVRVAYSAVSVGTEGAKMDFARSNLLAKARRRPDLVRSVLDGVGRDGLKATVGKVRTRLDEWTTMGYSASGRVERAGAEVTGFAVGDRVACGGDQASHGDYIAVPHRLCSALPEGASLEDAAYATIASVAMHGVRQADAGLGATVVVAGLGLIGQITCRLLRAGGCEVLAFDPSAERRAAVEALGVAAFDPTAELSRQHVEQRTNGRGADALVVTAASRDESLLTDYAQLVRDRGRIVVVGNVLVQIDRELMYRRELELRIARSYGPGRYDPEYEQGGHDYPAGYVRWTEQRNAESVLHLLATGALNFDGLTGATFALDDAGDAYRASSAASGAPGVLFRYEGADAEPAEPAA